MKTESTNLEDPSTVHVTLGTGQITVGLEHGLVQIAHALKCISISIGAIAIPSLGCFHAAYVVVQLRMLIACSHVRYVVYSHRQKFRNDPTFLQNT